MATVTFTIPNAFATRFNDAVAARFGYNATIHGTKSEFSKSVVTKWMKEQVLAHEAAIAAGQARATLESDVNGTSIT